MEPESASINLVIGNSKNHQITDQLIERNNKNKSSNKIIEHNHSLLIKTYTLTIRLMINNSKIALLSSHQIFQIMK